MAVNSMKKAETISTICRMCDHGCGIEVDVAEGQPVSLRGAQEHPYNKGWLCAKGRAALDFFHHPKRLTTPLIKKKGKFVPVDWIQSLDFAAETLNRLKNRYGPASLAIYHGEGVGHQEIKYYCYTHWQFRYISKLKKMSPEPIFEIHPKTANHYGISEGEMAEVWSPFGKIRLKACLSRKMLPDTIHISQGWEEANANELTGTENSDPVSGFPNLKSMRCNIRKLC